MKNELVREQQVPMESVYPIKITENYKFIRTDPFFLLFSHITYTLLHWFIGILYFRVLGKHHVMGRENLKLLKKKGFISIANHCHLFDTVLTGVAVLPRRPWYASVQRNFEAPYLRKLFRMGRGFPIPNGPIGLRRIMKPVQQEIAKGSIIHFFPEEELWHLYQDISHFQKGAFYLAHQSNCPVLPIVHMFKTRKIFGKERSKNILDITTVVGKPIYPSISTLAGSNPDMQSVERMSNEARLWMRSMLDAYHAR